MHKYSSIHRNGLYYKCAILHFFFFHCFVKWSIVIQWDISLFKGWQLAFMGWRMHVQPCWFWLEISSFCRFKRKFYFQFTNEYNTYNREAEYKETICKKLLTMLSIVAEFKKIYLIFEMCKTSLFVNFLCHGQW